MGCCGSSDKYELEIKVLRATNLPDVDLIGKIDPFVNIKYKGDEYKTDVIKGKDNPVWDNAIWRIEDAERGQADIIFNLSDWDRFTSNDFVGTAMVSRNDQNIPYNTPQIFDLPLTLQGENRGTLTVSIEFTHEGENPKEFAVAQAIENSNQTYGNSTTTTTTTTNNNTTQNNTTVVNQTTIIKKTVIVEETQVVKKQPRKKVVNKDGVEEYEDEIEEKERANKGNNAKNEDGVDKYADAEAGDDAGGDAPAENPVDMYAGAEPNDDKDKDDEGDNRVLANNNVYEFPIYKYNTNDKWLSSKKYRTIDMITIVTQCSIDRLPQLRAMCQSWSGIISVAVYIKDNINECKTKLKELFNEMERLYDCILDISLLYENERTTDILYPINHLRNLALNNASTELVFLLDVDFVTSLDMHNILLNNNKYKSILNIAKKTSLGLVIPAFEINTKETDIIYHPRTKDEIYNMVENNNASGFHINRFKYGHRATNYNYWFKTNKIYNIEYELMYEPYIIIKRDNLRKYDERYRGYGMNKIIHLAGLAMQDNVKFAVLPNIFVTASEHEKSVSYKKVYGTKNINSVAKKQKKQRKQWLKKLWKISLCELMEDDIEQNTKIMGINVEDNIRKDLVTGFSRNTALMV